jgi:hypothetical protein
VECRRQGDFLSDTGFDLVSVPVETAGDVLRIGTPRTLFKIGDKIRST